jgi:hypothetical protein
MIDSIEIDGIVVRESGPVHQYFGLTYASYKVLPRTLLQSMPIEWQCRFVQLMRELEDAYLDQSDGFPSEYSVTPMINGKFAKETIPHYRHGRVKPNL